MRNNKLFEWALAIILMCFIVGLFYQEVEYSFENQTLEA